MQVLDHALMAMLGGRLPRRHEALADEPNAGSVHRRLLLCCRRAIAIDTAVTMLNVLRQRAKSPVECVSKSPSTGQEVMAHRGNPQDALTLFGVSRDSASSALLAASRVVTCQSLRPSSCCPCAMTCHDIQHSIISSASCPLALLCCFVATLEGANKQQTIDSPDLNIYDRGHVCAVSQEAQTCNKQGKDFRAQ